MTYCIQRFDNGRRPWQPGQKLCCLLAPTIFGNLINMEEPIYVQITKKSKQIRVWDFQSGICLKSVWGKNSLNNHKSVRLRKNSDFLAAGTVEEKSKNIKWANMERNNSHYNRGCDSLITFCNVEANNVSSLWVKIWGTKAGRWGNLSKCNQRNTTTYWTPW